ncbi:MAG: Imm70 family immunity protein [Terracidiphilus sp.]|jgi:hypothetical protein
MGLYLCIFDENDQDIDGVEVGSYADFGMLRSYIVSKLEEGKAGARFPTFVTHSDCDGEWSPSDCDKLHDELGEIAKQLRALSAIDFRSDWQKTVARALGLAPKNAFESFIDVDGEPLIERLQSLVESARKRNLPILFQ